MATDIHRTCRYAPWAMAVLAWLTGCTVGPDYRRTDVEAPAAWSPAASAALREQPSRVDTRPFDGRDWWHTLGDPVLDGLIDEAARQNIDLQSAALRIASARVQANVAAGKALPTVAGSGIGGRTRMSEHGITSALSGGGQSSGSGAPEDTPSLTTNLFQVGFDATWELDLWGGVRRNIEAATAKVDEATDDRRSAFTSLAAEVARTYLTLRGSERQRAITRDDLAIDARMIELVESRVRSGLASTVDAAAQRAEVEASKAQLPAYDQAIAAARSRLALLLALPPGSLDARLAEAPPPRLPPAVPVGLPGELLQRRPDVRRAEDDLRAATASVGVATAKLYPSITLGGSAGMQATQTGDLLSWGSRFFLAGAAISVPIFQGGQLRAQVRLADLDAQRAALAYRQAVLSAVHEADDALTTYGDEQRRVLALDAARSQAAVRGELVEARWHQGLAAYLDVLDARRSLHRSELELAQSQLTAATDLVALFKALGGGWPQ